jgi:hypothetical protein
MLIGQLLNKDHVLILDVIVYVSKDEAETRVIRRERQSADGPSSRTKP